MTARFLISGLVQGVGYRYFAARQAERFGVAGWVENLADGRVEIVARGSPASIDALEAELRVGPGHARVETVTRVEISDDVEAGNTFVVRRLR